jgi:hypothetical protein
MCVPLQDMTVIFKPYDPSRLLSQIVTLKSENQRANNSSDELNFLQFVTGDISLPPPLNMLSASLVINNGDFYGRLKVTHEFVDKSTLLDPSRMYARRLMKSLETLEIVEDLTGVSAAKYFCHPVIDGFLILEKTQASYTVTCSDMDDAPLTTYVSFGTEGTRIRHMLPETQFLEEIMRLGILATDIVNAYCPSTQCPLEYVMSFKPVNVDEY